MSTYFWLIAGITLVVSEFVVPGVVLVFFGAAALSVAALAAAGVAETVAIQMGAFAFLSVIYLFALRDAFKRWFMGYTSDESDGSGLVDEFEGKGVRVVDDFVDGRGKVVLNGVKWDADSNADLKSGERATVTGKSSLTLHVRRDSR